VRQGAKAPSSQDRLAWRVATYTPMPSSRILACRRASLAG